MPKRRTELGTAPETNGRLRMVQWMEKNNHTVSAFARLIGATVASVHSWFWRLARPNQDFRGRVTAVVGGSADDWLSDDERADSEIAQQKIRERLEATA